MNSITSLVDLKKAIAILEVEQATKLVILKDQLDLSFESIKPANLIKSAFGEVASSPYLNQNVIGSIMGVAMGYLSNRVLLGGTTNKLGKIAGAFVQYAVTNLVANHSDTIRLFGQKLMDRFFHKKEENDDNP